MILKADPYKTVFVFDLDDTLFAEFGYLKSAYKEIVKTFFDGDQDLFRTLINLFLDGKNPFQFLLETYHGRSPDLHSLITLYRNHTPSIELYEDVPAFLDLLKVRGFRTCLQTDGRSITQRNKIKALGLENYFNNVIISEEFGSEKPDLKNYKVFEDEFPNAEFIFIADNPEKDFISANYLNWYTICLLDKGENIHKQNFNLEKKLLPLSMISSFGEIKLN
jgi:putative hydrolase of the HAD superfamily